MRIKNLGALCCVLAIAGIFAVGCSNRSTSEVAEPEPAETANEATPDLSDLTSEDSNTAAETAAEEEEPPPPPLEPYDPPPLEQLIAEHEWIDQPIRDGYEDFRKKQESEPRLVTDAAALQMKNQSPEDNEKILSALGKLPTDESQVDFDAVILRRTGADMRSTNPLMGSSTTEFEFAGLTGIGLISWDWNFEPFAPRDIVASWQVSSDYMVDKFVLRDDLTWSDGEPVTAHDFEFSFQAIMNPKVPASAMRTGTDQLRWVQAYDDHTLAIFHKQKSVTRKANISFPILPAHIYEQSIEGDPTMQATDYHLKYELNPVTSGAYELVQHRRGQEIVLASRESYYMYNGKQVRERPHFKEIRIQIIEDPNTALLALNSGAIDESPLSAEQWTTQTNGADFYERNTKVYGLEWVDFEFCWNCKTDFFSDVRVRKAMSYAFDYDEMLQKIFYGLYEPCNGVFHSTAKFASAKPQPYKQDLDKAEDLLDAAGWVDSDNDGLRDKMINGRRVPFRFSILVANLPERISVCELLKQNLMQIGVECSVRPLEFTVLQQKTNDHDFQASMGGWGTGTDPSTLKNIYGSGEGRNFGNYSNSEVDRLFDEGEKEFDETKRWAIYARIHEILFEDQPCTWLFFRSSFYGFDKKLRGYNFSPRGPYGVDPGFSSLWVPAVQ